MPLIFNPPYEPTTEGFDGQKKATTRRAVFEGGYSQRSSTGPNSVSQSLSLVWEVPNTAKIYIDDFLTAQKGVGSFYYQTPWHSAPLLWTCEEWGLKPTNAKMFGQPMWRISASFKQEFDIV